MTSSRVPPLITQTGSGGSGRIAIERLSRLTNTRFNFIPDQGAAEEKDLT